MLRSYATLRSGSILSILCIVTAISASNTWAVDSTSAPRPIPLTRPEMKQLLEDMKTRIPRIPLPELTEEEKTKLGERANSYESRIRSLYMPAGDSRGGFFIGGGGPGGAANTRSDRGAAEKSPSGTGATETRPGGSRGFGRESDPAMTLDYKFKTQLFWIVSRTNNCQY